MRYVIGIVALAAALAAGWDAAATGGLRALGEWWFALHPTSLQLAQPAVERHVAPWLWDPVALTLLRAPAALLLAGLAAALWLGGSARRALRG